MMQRSRTFQLLLALFGAGLATAPAGAQPVQGTVTSIGFESSLAGSRYVVRWGQWTPVVVNLTSVGSAVREVTLELHARDIDGDRVRYTTRTTLNPTEPTKNVWLYASVLPRERSRLEVVIRDETTGGEPVRVPVPPFEWIERNALLVLDISTRNVGALDRIDADVAGLQSMAWGNRNYYDSICVSRQPANTLPNDWIGLEAVDVIVWDEPNLGPGAVSAAQLTALRQWVENGGKLIIGVGNTASELATSPLADLLPATALTPTVSTDYLRRFASRFAALPEERFEAPLVLARIAPTDDARVLFRDTLPSNAPLDLVVEADAGYGEVVLVAARLRDLTELTQTPAFLELLLDINATTAGFRKQEQEADWTLMQQRTPLYGLLRRPIEFQRQASILIFGALIFVAGYICIATLVIWAWLGQQKARQHSWTAFSIVALLAGVTSLGAVGLTRGFNHSVHSVSFVDLDNEQPFATARTLFGYKSAQRTRATLSLPVAPTEAGGRRTFDNFLRPIPSGNEPPSEFATPTAYVAVPERGILSDVLIRATLKQLEGFWRGNFTGSISANLSVNRADGKITTTSTITNNLSVPIVGGVLLFIDPRLHDFDGGVPRRPFGLDARTDRPTSQLLGQFPIPPAINVLSVPLPTLPPGGTAQNLAAQLYQDWDQDYARWSAGTEPDPKREPLLPTLWHNHVRDWAPNLVGLGITGANATDAAGLLASTRGLYLHNSTGTFSRSDSFDSIGRPITTEGLPNLDVSHWLRGGTTAGQAVLLLVAEQPAPITLHVDGDPVEAARGRTYYRVRVPIRYVGNPPLSKGSQ